MYTPLGISGNRIKTGMILLLVLLVIMGCSPRVIYRTEIEHSTDTVTRERLIRDTATFYIPLEVGVEVVHDTVSYLENDYAESMAKIDELGYLRHELRTKPHEVKVPVTITVHDTTTVYRESEVKTVEVEKELSKWQRLQISGFWVFIFAIALMVASCFMVKKVSL